tara:strand:+ start:157 stop:525 length:369 start_codon:yes stop_codon:yes gene_type:complete
MPKLKSGGVCIEVSKYDGALKLVPGSDYAIGEEDTLVQDLIGFAKADKIKIGAYVPSAPKKGPYSPAQVGKFAETLDPVLMTKWQVRKSDPTKGFWTTYIAFFEPRGTVRPAATKAGKYARK